MNPVASNPLLGVLLHAVGAFFAATCYTPQKQGQALVLADLLAHPGGVLLVSPAHRRRVADDSRPYSPCCARPRASAMLNSFLLGAAYGIGGTAFGISIRYIGFSLTYAIAVGLSSVLGTLDPAAGQGHAAAPRCSKPGAGWIIAGIVVGAAGIALAGPAGRLKERDLSDQAARASSR